MSRKIGWILVSFLLVVAFIGLFWTPYDPNAMSILLKNGAPTLLHPFGTDSFGRDVLSRVMDGLGTSVLIALSVTIMGTVLGTMIGALTGYFGGIFDEIIMRINDALTAFPGFFLALILVSVMGSGKYNIILALGIVFIPSYARIVRSEFVKQREMDYVKNAKIMGASHLRIIYAHILPNTRSVILPAIAIGFNNAVLSEAGMSYLGLGVQPPDASLGRMISDAAGYLTVSPWTAVFPGLTMILTIYAFSLLGGKRQ